MKSFADAMAHTTYPYEVTPAVQVHQQLSVANARWTYLICLFFVMLAGWATYVMFHLPPDWDLSQ